MLPTTPRSHGRGRDSNPRSRAHEAREDSHSSTAQVWLAGVEPAVSGFQGRRGGQTPPQPDLVTPGRATDTFNLVGDRGLLPRLLPFGTRGAPYREVDQPWVMPSRRCARLCPSPARDDRRKSAIARARAVVVTPAVPRTVLSMPLARPSTLDREVFLASYAEGRWSPMFTYVTENGRRRPHPLSQVF